MAYTTPGLRAGVAVSGLGVVGFVAVLALPAWRRRRAGTGRPPRRRVVGSARVTGGGSSSSQAPGES
jgi:hypothetical protein